MQGRGQSVQHRVMAKLRVPRDLLDPVVEYFKPQRVILFGSRALAVIDALAARLRATNSEPSGS
jgi:hypothetical protein